MNLLPRTATAGMSEEDIIKEKIDKFLKELPEPYNEEKVSQ